MDRGGLKKVSSRDFSRLYLRSLIKNLMFSTCPISGGVLGEYRQITEKVFVMRSADRDVSHRAMAMKTVDIAKMWRNFFCINTIGSGQDYETPQPARTDAR